MIAGNSPIDRSKLDTKRHKISCIISTIRKISKKLTIPNRNQQNKIKILQNIIDNL